MIAPRCSTARPQVASTIPKNSREFSNDVVSERPYTRSVEEFVQRDRNDSVVTQFVGKRAGQEQLFLQATNAGEIQNRY